MISLSATTIRLADIDWDTSAAHCQVRQSTQADVVSEYAAAMKAGIEFPPIVVFTDGDSLWLVDGYHRCEAAEDMGIEQLPADIREGTLRDAILFAVGVNASHGVRRTNDDKRRAVLTLLNDESWSKWSDRKIARQCCVSQPFVSSLRKSTDNRYQCDTRTYERDGEVREMNTANIGKPKAEAEDRPADEPPRPEPVCPEFDEGDTDIDAYEAFPNQSPPPNKFGQFYDLIRERAKAVLTDAPAAEYYVVAGQLHAIAEELERDALRVS